MNTSYMQICGYFIDSEIYTSNKCSENVFFSDLIFFQFTKQRGCRDDCLVQTENANSMYNTQSSYQVFNPHMAEKVLNQYNGSDFQKKTVLYNTARLNLQANFSYDAVYHYTKKLRVDRYFPLQKKKKQNKTIWKPLKLPPPRKKP